MPKPTKGPRIGGSPAHERIIMANLASQLFEHGRITTTETRAKRVQPLAERLINKAKRGDLAARRQVLKTVTDKSVVHVLFTEIGPAVAEREGGYTRVIKVGNRKGDNAPMAVIELVTEPVKSKPKAKKAAAKSEAPKAEASPKAQDVEETTTQADVEPAEGAQVDQDEAAKVEAAKETAEDTETDKA